MDNYQNMMTKNKIVQTAGEEYLGTVIHIPANVKQWHGATADSWFAHLTFRREQVERMAGARQRRGLQQAGNSLADQPPKLYHLIVYTGLQSFHSTIQSLTVRVLLSKLTATLVTG